MHIVEMMEEVERLFEIIQTDRLVQLILAQKLGEVVQTLLMNGQFLQKIYSTEGRVSVSPHQNVENTKAGFSYECFSPFSPGTAFLL